jgi:hypothetical protein
MRTHVSLRIKADERVALRALTVEEREAVVDQLLDQVREELEWLLALEAARDTRPPALPRLRDARPKGRASTPLKPLS